MIDSKLFTPASIGPLTLRNRTIRSAAFESMCPGNVPSQQLLDYHRSVAAGGVGMTTIAYAAVAQSGLSFDRQLWMRPEIVPGLKDITDAIHKEGAAAGIQLGHCGNMSHKSICGVTPVGASSGFNLYSPTFVRGLRRECHRKETNMKQPYIPQPIDVSRIELPAALAPLTEALARNVHEVWAATRIAQGWRFGPERNDARKEHPCLIPYEELPEEERTYDRQTALETLKLIEHLGFEIRKR